MDFFDYLLAISYVNLYKCVAIFFCPCFVIILSPPLSATIWALGIGDGCIGDVTDDSIKVDIPDDLLIKSSGDHIASIVECIYPSILLNMHDTPFFQDRAILTPKNTIVDEVNNYVMSLILGEERTYLSCDSLIADTASVNRPDDIHTPEFLNTTNSSGLPNHKITLKVGVPIMLLRNLDITVGLCNGT